MFSQDQTDLERIGLQIIFVLLILSSIGLIMVYSSSYIYAKDVYGSSAYFFLRQLAYFMIGLSVAFLVSKIWPLYKFAMHNFVNFFNHSWCRKIC